MVMYRTDCLQTLANCQWLIYLKFGCKVSERNSLRVELHESVYGPDEVI